MLEIVGAVLVVVALVVLFVGDRRLRRQEERIERETDYIDGLILEELKNKVRRGRE